jgi:ribosomal protein S18 acetylase RimI-like enzyme
MIDIRPIGADQAERFKALRIRSLEDSPNAFDSTVSMEGPMHIKDWKRWVTGSPERQVVVAEENDQWVGTATLAPFFAQPEVLTLFALWVAPEARRKGVGRKLIHALLAHAKGSGRKRIRVHVGETNAGGVLFFEKMGFVDTGLRLPFREELGDAFVMERPVD